MEDASSHYNRLRVVVSAFSGAKDAFPLAFDELRDVRRM